MELFTAGWASLLSCFYLFFSGIIVSYVAVARMVHCCLFFLSPSSFLFGYRVLMPLHARVAT